MCFTIPCLCTHDPTMGLVHADAHWYIEHINTLTHNTPLCTEDPTMGLAYAEAHWYTHMTTTH